ncbi:GrpB family protein [Nocardioides seonyuensis]|uniref:GrpB family protein n=1 Tax=Nocardioides seonyuensis TaxID=2518371 RepID=A0A4P7IEH4_9ACTN|nr:GrpB family protein [Nocardioides seonyuensis]QBX55120.1 GrpB family protein [Nocardioides seonyuensis]
MPVEVVPYSADWPGQFDRVAADLRAAVAHVPSAAVEHVGSTSVPGLAAKPVLDIDVIVEPEDAPAATAALESIGYVHRGDLGVTGREAFTAPDDQPRRHVYVCLRDTLNVRNHLAVRDVLRARPDLRDEYAAVKLSLAADPGMDIDTYIARKSAVLQEVLAASDLTEEERLQILRLNDPDGGAPGR